MPDAENPAEAGLREKTAAGRGHMGEDGISAASFLVFCRRTTAKDLCSELNRERQKTQPQSPSIFYKCPRKSPRYYAYDREETFQGPDNFDPGKHTKDDGAH